jgi:hypothetical protein
MKCRHVFPFVSMSRPSWNGLAPGEVKKDCCGAWAALNYRHTHADIIADFAQGQIRRQGEILRWLRMAAVRMQLGPLAARFASRGANSSSPDTGV